MDKEKVNLVVDDLIKYANNTKLSWLQAYREVIKKYDIEYENHAFLNSVIREITNRRYDIMDNPFKLEKF